jgi:hypothetical protein
MRKEEHFMAAQTIEERLAQLENKVALLMVRTSPEFLDTMVGIHANSPEFEDMVRSLEEERRREREAACHTD